MIQGMLPNRVLTAGGCLPIPILLEGRSANGTKTKVGFASPLAGQSHRYFLRRDTALSYVIQGYQDSGANTSGSLDSTQQSSSTYDRFSTSSTDLAIRADIDVSFTDSQNGPRTASYHGSYSPTGNQPAGLTSALALGDELSSAFGASYFANLSTSSVSPVSTPVTLTQFLHVVVTTVLGGSGVAGTSTQDPQYALVTLSQEYTTDLLIGDAKSLAASALPSSWSPLASSAVPTFQSSLSLSNDDIEAGVTLGEWKATLASSEADQAYELRWEESFRPQGASSPGPWTPRSRRISGTGEPISHSEQVPIPSQPGTITVKVLGAFPVGTTAGDPGAGSAAGLGAGCLSCGSGGATDPFGAGFDMGLGVAGDRLGAGSIAFASAATTGETTAWRNLRWNGSPRTGDGIEAFVRFDGGLRQISTKQTFVDVSALPYGLEVRFFPLSARGALINSSEGYAVVSGSTPFRTFRIENPDGASAIDRVRITQDPGPAERRWEYQRNANGTSWKLSFPGSLSTAARVQQEDLVSGNVRTKTESLFALSNGGTTETLQQRSRRIFTKFPITNGGDPIWESLTQSVQGEGAMVISTFVNGRLTTTQRRNSSGTQIGRVTQTYDAHGRPVTVTDDRNGTITHQYVAGSDLVWKVTTPPSGTGDPGQTTVCEYDVVGRAWKVTHPDGGIVNTTYTPRGEVATTYGARSYPVEHTYDSQGRMKTLKTW